MNNLRIRWLRPIEAWNKVRKEDNFLAVVWIGSQTFRSKDGVHN